MENDNYQLFENNILSIYGEKGSKWLNQLSSLIKDISDKYQLLELSQVKNLSYNYLLSGLKNNQTVILKLGLDTETLKREADALKAFSGYGSIKLLAQDNSSMILVKCAIPGISLKSYLNHSKDEAIGIICQLIQTLHKTPIPNQHSFPYINDLLKIIDYDWPINKNYLKIARILRDKLLSVNMLQILLHGDLHHDNIKKDKGNWITIDPYGIRGYPINEMWTFVIDIEQDTEYIAKFFNFDLQYVIEWYFLHLILNICQSLKNNTTPELFFNLIEQVYPLVLR